MGIVDIFKKREKTNETLTDIKIGDWVTQFSAGYWMVIDIFPKYADRDHSYNGKTWKKGDRRGDWVVLKKGFTPKMKPSNACDCLDAQLCQTVSEDIKDLIETAFAENPKAKAKFEKATNIPQPYVASTWMALTDEQVESFSEHIKNLPERFSLEQFWSLSASYKQYIVAPSSANHILYLYSYLWEIDDDFQPLHFGPEIKKL